MRGTISNSSSIASNRSKHSQTKSYFSIGSLAIFVVVCWFVGLLYYYRISYINHQEYASQHLKSEISEQNSNNNLRLEVSKNTVIDELHIVFSTDCTFFQDWQSLLVFNSAKRIKQQGKITRIASGCDEQKQKELIDLYKKLFPEYSVHFTPDYKKDGKTKKKYDFYNKPYGLKHWLENSNPPIPSNVIVALIDPDFIFLRPLVTEVAGHPSNLFLDNFNRDVDKIPDRVKKGTPVAQLYGIGAPWTNDGHRLFNRTEVCGKTSSCMKITGSFGQDHFRVYARNPDLLAEMYAYSLAAAHTDLPHFTMHHYMVSNTDMSGEGWPWIDPMGDDVCEPPVNGVFFPGKPLPIFMHYCQFFRAGEIGFQKRRIRKSLFECDKPMMLELPKDLGKVRYKNRDGEILPISERSARRNAFSLCVIHESINHMVSYYKSVMCPKESISNEKLVNLVDKKYWS